MPNSITPSDIQNATWNDRQIRPQPYIPADSEKIKNAMAAMALRIASITKCLVFIGVSSHLGRPHSAGSSRSGFGLREVREKFRSLLERENRLLKGLRGFGKKRTSSSV